MSLGVNRRSQPAYISSIFEVHSEVSSTLSAPYGFRSVNSGINCAGIDGNTPLEHELFLTYYAAQGVGLSVGNMHFTSGKFFPLNSEPIPRAVTELSHAITAGDADTFPGSLTNNVSLNSIGIVVSKRIVQEEAYDGKPICVFVMRHTDYNPMTTKLCEFMIEYWCRPVRNLAKAMNIIQLGKEMSVHGYIYGRDTNIEKIGGREVKSYIFQVEIYSMSVATGHEAMRAGGTFTTPTATRLTKGGRVRLQRATDNAVSDVGSSPTPSSSSNVLNGGQHFSSSPSLPPPPVLTGIASTPEDEAALASYLHQVASAPEAQSSAQPGPNQVNPCVQAGKRPRRA